MVEPMQYNMSEGDMIFANSIIEIFTESFSKPNDQETAEKNLIKMGQLIKSRDTQRDKAIEIVAQISVLKKVGQAYHKEERQDKAREALSMALWAEIRELESQLKGKEEV